MTDFTSTHPVSSTHREGLLLNSARSCSWGAIFAGVAIAISSQFVLNLLGAGIGTAIINPVGQSAPDASTVSTTSAIWFVVSSVISVFLGAYVAGRLSHRIPRSGGLHGLTVWAATTILLLYLVTTSIGALVSGAFGGVSTILSGTGSTIATAATAAAPSFANATNPLQSIEQQVRNVSGGNDPAALRDAAVASMQALLTGDAAKQEEARNRAADALAKAQNISVDDARQQVTQYEQQYRQSVEQAKQAAAKAATEASAAFSKGALMSALALVIGALAGFLGGSLGGRVRA